MDSINNVSKPLQAKKLAVKQIVQSRINYEVPLSSFPKLNQPIRHTDKLDNMGFCSPVVQEKVSGEAPLGSKFSAP